MLRYTLRQLLNVAVTLVGVSLLVFALNELTPIDVARKLLGPYATQDQVDILYKQMGLDRSAFSRYLDYVGSALSGKLGVSNLYQRPVAEVLRDRLGNTLMLAAICFACIVPFSGVLGVIAGMRERGLAERAISLFASLRASIPGFALGVFWIAIFVVELGVLPA